MRPSRIGGREAARGLLPGGHPRLHTRCAPPPPPPPSDLTPHSSGDMHAGAAALCLALAAPSCAVLCCVLLQDAPPPPVQRAGLGGGGRQGLAADAGKGRTAARHSHTPHHARMHATGSAQLLAVVLAVFPAPRIHPPPLSSCSACASSLTQYEVRACKRCACTASLTALPATQPAGSAYDAVAAASTHAPRTRNALHALVRVSGSYRAAALPPPPPASPPLRHHLRTRWPCTRFPAPPHAQRVEPAGPHPRVPLLVAGLACVADAARSDARPGASLARHALCPAASVHMHDPGAAAWAVQLVAAVVWCVGVGHTHHLRGRLPRQGGAAAGLVQ